MACLSLDDAADLIHVVLGIHCTARGHSPFVRAKGCLWRGVYLLYALVLVYLYGLD